MGDPFGFQRNQPISSASSLLGPIPLMPSPTGRSFDNHRRTPFLSLRLGIIRAVVQSLSLHGAPKAGRGNKCMFQWAGLRPSHTLPSQKSSWT